MTVLYMYDNDFARVKIGLELPTFSIVMRDVIGCWLCHEFVFYYSHRLLHTKWLYPLHKTHHEFSTPTVLIAQYCGIFEAVFGNFFPSVSGIRLIGPHITTALLWGSIMLITIITDHCGYYLPFIHSPQLHDYHHLV